MSETELDISSRQVYEEILKNRKELKNVIEASEARVLLKIETLNHKLTNLEEENLELKSKIEILERKNRQNNVVIFGLHKPQETSLVEFTTQQLRNLLDVCITEADLNNIYILGRSPNSPVKIEFISYIKKNLILRNCHKLKGTNIRISHDLTAKQREDNRIIRVHLNRLKEDNVKCYIKNNRLFINDVPHTAADLDNFIIEENIIRKPNSAPSTPTVRNTSREILQVTNQATIGKNELTSNKIEIASQQTEILERPQRETEDKAHLKKPTGKKNEKKDTNKEHYLISSQPSTQVIPESSQKTRTRSNK